MFSIPENVLRIVLLVLNSCFVITGIGYLFQGIYLSITSSKDVIMTVSDNDQADSTTPLILGCLDIVIGGCGIAGTVLKNRLMLMVNAAVLGVYFLGNLIALIYLGVTAGQLPGNAYKSIAGAIETHYGNNHDETGKKFTLAIDDNHRLESCCGWSGLDGVNIFLRSPWYKNINVNNTGPSKITLPDSCCEKRDPGCFNAENLKEARANGFVLKRDCMDKMIGGSLFYMYVFIVMTSLIALMQVVSLAATGLVLMQEA